MKKTKILIFGKNSFIGSSLYSKLKSHFTVNIANYKIQKLNKIKNYDFIINCSTNKNYTKIKYLQKNDFDLQIAKKIKKEKTHLIFLSSRKVYRPGPNLNENSKIECKKHYERNKYISEKAISKIKKSNLTILRISNLIGYKKKSKRSIHNTYLDTLLKEVRNGKNINNNNAYKDFLDIKTFSKIIYLIIKNKVNGIFNVSIGKKIYLNFKIFLKL